MRRTMLILSMSLLTLFSYAQDKQALGIFQKTNSKLNQNKSILYDYTYEGWGKNNGRFKGKVYIDKNAGMKIGILLKTINDNNEVVLEEFIFTDGNKIELLDKTNKILKKGSAFNGSSYLMSYGWYAIFREFLMPDPLAMNYENKTLAYDGSNKVDQVDCHKVSLVNQWGDKNIWYISKSDHQIHGQKTLNENPETEGGFEFLMTNVKYNQAIEKEVFQINEEGVQVIDEDTRQISPGNPAPEWKLIDLNNKDVSSRQLIGKKVLLDFWASWCSPCWQIMPVIDKIKTDYADHNISVYGVNVWENPSLDIKAYLEKKGLLAYENLLDINATVAKSFKIGALPFVVLIDENGQILYVNSGIDANMDQNIRKLLDK